MAGQGTDPPRDLQPIDDRHPHVGQDDVEIAAPDRGDGGLAVRDLGDLVAGGAQKIGRHGAGQVEIVREQNMQMADFGRSRQLVGLGDGGWRGGRLRERQLDPEHAAAARIFRVANLTAHAAGKPFA